MLLSISSPPPELLVSLVPKQSFTRKVLSHTLSCQSELGRGDMPSGIFAGQVSAMPQTIRLVTDSGCEMQRAKSCWQAGSGTLSKGGPYPRTFLRWYADHYSRCLCPDWTSRGSVVIPADFCEGRLPAPLCAGERQSSTVHVLACASSAAGTATRCAVMLVKDEVGKMIELSNRQSFLPVQCCSLPGSCSSSAASRFIVPWTQLG